MQQDLEELWRRILFSICIKNTDDHLRNHGFLLSQQGWQLSPLYDANPFPDGTGLTLNISDSDNSLNPDLALSVASMFRISPKDANRIMEEVLNAASRWQKIAENIGISRRKIEMMEPAFIIEK